MSLSVTVTPPVKSTALTQINKEILLRSGKKKKKQKLLGDRYYSWSVAVPAQDGLTQAQAGQHRLVSRWRSLREVQGLKKFCTQGNNHITSVLDNTFHQRIFG